MTPQEEFESRKERAYAQLDLIKTSIQARHQSVITIGVGSISILVVVSFIEMSLFLRFIIASILIVNVIIWWFDVLSVRKSLLRSQALLNEALPKNAEDIEKINSEVPLYVQNFPELIAAFFTLLVALLVCLLFFNPIENQNLVKSTHHREPVKKHQFIFSNREPELLVHRTYGTKTYGNYGHCTTLPY